MDTDEKKGHGEKYGRSKEVALAALLNSKTLKEAAQKTGIGVSTLRRWLQTPDFRKDYDEARRQVLEMATHSLSGAVIDAIRVLRDQAKRTNKEAKDRIAAANAILNMYDKEMQRYDTQRRLNALEQKMAEEEATEN